MSTKMQAMLMVVVFAAAGPAVSGNMTGTHVNVKKVLSNGPHMPPIITPQNGGVPGPTCLPGGSGC